MGIRSTGRGWQPTPTNPVHTATAPNGDAYTCGCARTLDHMVTQRELAAGSWKDTHPVLF